jgi:hypothetical protein
VTDDHAGAVPAEGLLKRQRVLGEVEKAEPARGKLSRRISAEERRDRVIAPLGERGEQVAPGPGAVRESVQAEDQAVGATACLERAEPKPSRVDEGFLDRRRVQATDSQNSLRSRL